MSTNSRKSANVWKETGQATERTATGSLSTDVVPSSLAGQIHVVARDGKRVVGALTVWRDTVEKVYVTPSHRRRGIATTMYEAAADHLGARPRRLSDDVSPSGADWANAAIPEGNDLGREFLDTWGTDGQWESWLRRIQASDPEGAEALRRQCVDVVVEYGMGTGASAEPPVAGFGPRQSADGSGVTT